MDYTLVPSGEMKRPNKGGDIELHDVPTEVPVRSRHVRVSSGVHLVGVWTESRNDSDRT